MDPTTSSSRKPVKKMNMREPVSEDENHFSTLLVEMRSLRAVMERTEEKVNKVEESVERMEDKMEKRITAVEEDMADSLFFR